jgi:hypothetical protein
MKNTSYIQYGLLAFALALYMLRTREGFEEAKCPEGSVQHMGGKCRKTGGLETDPVCPPDTVLEGGRCTYRDGSKSAPSDCPQGRGYDPTKRKCMDLVTKCGPNSEIATLFTSQGRAEKTICIPKDASTYPITLPEEGAQNQQNIANVCRPGDRLIDKSAGMDGPAGRKMMCLSMTPLTTSSTTTSDVQPRDTQSSQNAIVSSTFKEVINSLKPFRPPTAPASDLEKERKEITDIAKRSLYFIQIALFLVVVAMLSYVILPLDTANLVAFALLCVGIALGFFLRR